MKTDPTQIKNCRTNPATAWTWLFLAATFLCIGAVAARAQFPGVVTDHSNYYPGERISVTFERGPGNPRDWVGIYPDGVEPGPTPSTLWQYVNGTQAATTGKSEGVLAFSNGLTTVGDWVAFFLLNDGYVKLAQTTFKVIDPGLPLVHADKRRYLPGEAISITFTNGPGNPTDWIGIYPKDVVPGSTPSTLWFYVNGTRTATTGRSDGTLRFAGGLPKAGDYDVHLLLNDGYEVAASEVFTVTEFSALKPRLISLQPAKDGTNLPPVLEFVATITNGTSKVIASSVALKIDGVKVTHIFTEQNNLVRVAYTNESLLPPLSQHTYELTFADSATPPNTFTNQGAFSVADYRDIKLPAPLYFEDFDNTPEGALPSGWTEVNFTEAQNPDFDLDNLDSASYATWTVVSADRFTKSFVTYSNPDNPQSWEDDYHRVLSQNLLNVVNGKVLHQPLATGRFLFGDSGYRNGRSQVLYVFTPDYNLSGKTDVYLAYHSLWEQNQDSIGAVEYSIDAGQTWLPIVYMLDGPDVIRDDTGKVDAVATFTEDHGDAAHYTDPLTGEEKGGAYGSFIGAVVSQELAPFISVRFDDNASESKRVELFRLPKADNQAKVRFRFAHAGTDSWYFGIDNFGLYSIPAAPATTPKLSVAIVGASATISWPATIAGFVLESADTINAAVWTPVSGVANNSVTQSLIGGSKFFRLRKP